MHWTWYAADTADFGWKWINNFVTAAACFSPKPWAKSKMNFKTFWLDFEFWLFDHTFTWSSPIAIEVSKLKGYPSIHRVIAVAMLPESHPSHPHPMRGPRALDSLCFAGVVWVAFLVFLLKERVGGWKKTPWMKCVWISSNWSPGMGWGEFDVETSVAQGDDQGSCFPKCLGFHMSIEFNRCQWWISQVWPQFWQFRRVSSVLHRGWTVKVVEESVPSLLFFLPVSLTCWPFKGLRQHVRSNNCSFSSCSHRS